MGLIVSVLLIVGPQLATSDSAGLRQAETMIAGLLRSARAVSVMNKTRGRLLISQDLSVPENRLALLAVVLRDESGAWTLVGEPVRLPEPVRIVPANAVPTPAGVAWPAKIVSTFSGSETMSVDGLPTGNYSYLEFTVTGSIAVSKQLVFSLCDRSSPAPVFVALDQMRCFLLRTSGNFVLLREGSSL